MILWVRNKRGKTLLLNRSRRHSLVSENPHFELLSPTFYDPESDVLLTLQ